MQVGLGEQCDDGANGDDTDGCNDLCETIACGDGITQASEECDDGNLANGDGCNDLCVIEACGN